jgi:hypothetical protein
MAERRRYPDTVVRPTVDPQQTSKAPFVPSRTSENTPSGQ